MLVSIGVKNKHLSADEVPVPAEIGVQATQQPGEFKKLIQKAKTLKRSILKEIRFFDVEKACTTLLG
jgi:hypothetical protein